MEEDIYQQLKELEEQHVRAVRGLEKLAKALEHVGEARTELSDLSEDANLNPTLSDLPEQLKVIKDALEEETWRTRGYITDIELEQGYLRKRLQVQERPPPSSFHALPNAQERTNTSFSSSLRSSTWATRRKKSTGICLLLPVRMLSKKRGLYPVCSARSATLIPRFSRMLVRVSWNSFIGGLYNVTVRRS